MKNFSCWVTSNNLFEHNHSRYDIKKLKAEPFSETIRPGLALQQEKSPELDLSYRLPGSEEGTLTIRLLI